MTFLRTFIAPALIAGITGTAAGAQSVSASDPQSLADALLAFGHPAEIVPDVLGDPSIDSAVDRETYSILFYGCTANKNCKDVEFWVVLLPDEQPEQALIDNWNAENPEWSAYLDEDGDANMEFYIGDLDGMPVEDFTKIIAAWDASLREFMEIMGPTDWE